MAKFEKVQRGRPLDISAEVWNAMLDAAKAHKGKRHDQQINPAQTFRQGDVVKIKNASGLDLPRLSVLGISDVIISPDENLREFKNQVAFVGTVPTAKHEGKFVILLDALRADRIGRAWVSGVVPVKLKVSDDCDCFAEVHPGYVDHLLTSDYGSSQVLWKEPGTGLKWGVVRIGNILDCSCNSSSSSDSSSSESSSSQSSSSRSSSSASSLQSSESISGSSSNSESSIQSSESSESSEGSFSASYGSSRSDSSSSSESSSSGSESSSSRCVVSASESSSSEFSSSGSASSTSDSSSASVSSDSDSSASVSSSQSSESSDSLSSQSSESSRSESSQDSSGDSISSFRSDSSGDSDSGYSISEGSSQSLSLSGSGDSSESRSASTSDSDSRSQSDSQSDHSEESASDSGKSDYSDNSDNQSDKSTAIVPAAWSPTGYVALHVLEAPEVRFDDLMTVVVNSGDDVTVPIDPKYVTVCHRDTIEVCGIAPDQPAMVGAKVVGDHVRLRLRESIQPGSEPLRIVLRLTAIRRGFLGKRFPERTREQFVANERFIQSAYPGAGR
jgi:hypothetical protein